MPDLICEAPTRIFQHTLKNGGFANGRFAKLFFATIRAAIGRIRTFWARCWQSLGPGGRIRTILRCSGPDVGKVSAPEDEPQTTKTQKLVITSPPCATPPHLATPEDRILDPRAWVGVLRPKKTLRRPPTPPRSQKTLRRRLGLRSQQKNIEAPVGGGRQWAEGAGQCQPLAPRLGRKTVPGATFWGQSGRPSGPKLARKKQKTFGRSLNN